VFVRPHTGQAATLGAGSDTEFNRAESNARSGHRADDSRHPEGRQRRFDMNQRRFEILITRFEKPEPFSFPSIFADACDIVPV
jgi:hypothetical protein